MGKLIYLHHYRLQEPGLPLLFGRRNKSFLCPLYELRKLQKLFVCCPIGELRKLQKLRK